MIRRWALMLAIALPAQMAAMADAVFLHNGDRLSGEVASISGGLLLLGTDYAGRLPIKMAAIKSIETDQDLRLRMRDGVRLTGRLTTLESGPVLVVAAEEHQPVELASVASAVHTTTNILQSPIWSSRLELSSAIATGNSDTLAANMLLESSLQRPKSTHDWSLLINQEEADGVTAKEQIDLDYGYKRFLTEQWFGAGQIEYFRDPLKDIDRQITLGASLGYQVWNNSISTLSVEAGVSTVLEKIVNKENNPAFRWGLDYTRRLWGERLELFHKHSLLVIADKTRGNVIDAASGLRLAVTDRTNAHLRIDHQIDTQPAPGAKKTDTTYSLGVGVLF